MQPTVTILLSHFEQLKDEVKSLRSGMVWTRDSNGMQYLLQKSEVEERVREQAKQIESLARTVGEHIVLKARVSAFNKLPWWRKPFNKI